MPFWIDSIVPVNDGELVNQQVTNRSINVIINNLRYLKSLIDSGVSSGPAIVAPNQPMSSTCAVSTPVWFNPSTLRYEPAKATASQDPSTGSLVIGPEANCLGVVVSKSSATVGNVLLAGKYALDISAAVGGPASAGRYYLSATTAGGLTKTRPAVTVSVLFCDGVGNVHVLPDVRDFFLGDHTHYHFDLVAGPAGDTSPPAFAGKHVITNPDVTKEGWLPANHGSFNGNAPAGAVFGYNLNADTDLQAVWPPIPLGAFSIEVTKFNTASLVRYSSEVTLDFNLGPGAQGPQSSGSQGVQGSQGPPHSLDSWELAVPVPAAVVGDVAFAEPRVQLQPDLVWDAYVVHPGYVNVRLATVTGTPIDVNPGVWEVGVVKAGQNITPVNPIGLVSIDANGIWWYSNCYGEAPWPTDRDTSLPGPQATGPQCPLDPDRMAITLSFARLSFGTENVLVSNLAPDTGSPVTVRDVYGNTANFGSLVLGLNLTRQLPARVTLLTGVDEQGGAGFHYWRFPAGGSSSLRGEFEVPDQYMGASPTVQLRLLLYGSAFGTLGPLSLTCRRIARPGSVGSPATPPPGDTAVSLTTNHPVSTGQYVEAVSAAIPVAAGDLLVFNLSRGASDGYPGDMGVIRAQGVLTST